MLEKTAIWNNNGYLKRKNPYELGPLKIHFNDTDAQKMNILLGPSHTCRERRNKERRIKSEIEKILM